MHQHSAMSTLHVWDDIYCSIGIPDPLIWLHGSQCANLQVAPIHYGCLVYPICFSNQEPGQYIVLVHKFSSQRAKWPADQMLQLVASLLKKKTHHSKQERPHCQTKTNQFFN